jgi:hypothetical protein
MKSKCCKTFIEKFDDAEYIVSQALTFIALFVYLLIAWACIKYLILG